MFQIPSHQKQELSEQVQLSPSHLETNILHIVIGVFYVSDPLSSKAGVVRASAALSFTFNYMEMSLLMQSQELWKTNQGIPMDHLLLLTHRLPRLVLCPRRNMDKLFV
jgi:hypothetical protein